MTDIEIYERVAKVETKVDTILGNHLPHIQAGIDRVDNRSWWILGSVLVMGIAGIAFSYFK